MVVRAFVPKKSIGRLSSAISKYGEWSEGQHKPAFTDFFEGIDNLTVADVERLWHARDGVNCRRMEFSAGKCGFVRAL